MAAATASLAGRTALVCGVSNERSISWGIARAMHEAGARVALSYGPGMEKRVRPLAERIGCDFVEPCDAASDADVEALFAKAADRLGGIDALAHGVVGAKREDLARPFIETSRDGFLQALEISVYSLVAMTRAAAPLMADGGSVTTLTYHGSQKMMPSYNVMGVAKAALESAVRYLASDVGPRGVRVNAISAGPVRTLSAAGVGEFRNLYKVFPKVTPLRRHISIEDVGAAAAFLASDAAANVSGQVLYVDGGFHTLGMAMPDAPDADAPDA